MNYLPIKIAIISVLGFLSIVAFFSFLIFPTESVLEGMVMALAIGVVIVTLSVSFFIVGDFSKVSTILFTRSSLTLGIATLIGGSGIVVFFGSVLLDWLHVIQGMFFAFFLFAIATFIGMFNYSRKYFRTINNYSDNESFNQLNSNLQINNNIGKSSYTDYEGEASIKYSKQNNKSNKILHCENCGSILDDDSIFCKNCGSQQ